jgi:hypothetical protein
VNDQRGFHAIENRKDLKVCPLSPPSLNNPNQDNRRQGCGV